MQKSPAGKFFHTKACCLGGCKDVTARDGFQQAAQTVSPGPCLTHNVFNLFPVAKARFSAQAVGKKFFTKAAAEVFWMGL